MMIPRPFPIIETENLQMRRMATEDVPDIFQMRSDPRTHEYTDTKPDVHIDETAAYIARMNRGVDEGRWAVWAIVHKHSQKVIGSLCIWNPNEEENSAELGYGLIPLYRGRGLMKEALLSAVGYTFRDMKIGVLRAYTEEGNVPSKRLLERCGFAEVGRIDEQGRHQDRLYHMVIYELKNTAEQNA